jgi:hypothetical protein
VWLHLKCQEDTTSSGDGAEDDEFDASEGGDNDADVGGHALDKAEMAAFDDLMSAPAEDTTTALSNVELLSSVDTVVSIGSVGSRDDDNDDDDDDDLGFDDILAASKLEDSSAECMFTRSMTSSMTNDNELQLFDSFTRPRTGSVIESGRGDLIASPVRSSTSNISLPRIPSFLRAGASLAKAKLSLPWKSGGAVSGLSDGQTEYIIEAADLISQAQEHELVGSYQAAFSKYKGGIGILLRGVQSKII